jgi:hypothetical protein
MVEDLIEKTYEIFSEFAKHLLKISNKNNLLHLSLTNINTGLYFEDVFNLEKLNQISKNSIFSTIESTTKLLCNLIENHKYQLTTKENMMLIKFINPIGDKQNLEINLPYIETAFCEEDERIIQNRDIKLILSWINPSSKHLKLNLIYKATRDGDTPKIFHQKVDGKKNTVTVILTDKGYRCGGFITKEWNISGEFNKNDVNSFLFSLDRRENYLVNLDEYTNFNDINYGPSFGKGFDLIIGENADHFLKSDRNYSKFPNSSGDNSYIVNNENKGLLTGGYENFLISEIETYEVIFNEDFSDDEQDDNH